MMMMMVVVLRERMKGVCSWSEDSYSIRLSRVLLDSNSECDECWASGHDFTMGIAQLRATAPLFTQSVFIKIARHLLGDISASHK